MEWVYGMSTWCDVNRWSLVDLCLLPFFLCFPYSCWGGLFRVEWLNRTSLPFDSIPSDLTNPWNSDKPVKIGFDGTELEPSVGQRLRALWEQGNSWSDCSCSPTKKKKNHKIPRESFH